MNARGKVHKYGDNVDTDVIIPARYLNTADHKELASHCMEDIDKSFTSKVKDGDIIVGGSNFGCGSSRTHSNQKFGNFLRYCKDLCKNIFQKFHKYRSGYTRMSRGKRKDRRRWWHLNRFWYGDNYQQYKKRTVPCWAVSCICKRDYQRWRPYEFT